MSTADENYYRFGQITYSLFISYAIPPYFQVSDHRQPGNSSASSICLQNAGIER